MTKSTITLIAAGMVALSGTAAAQHHDGADHGVHDHGAADPAAQSRAHGAQDHAAGDHDAHAHGEAREDAALDAAPAALPTDAARTITVRVNGMVCDFCARSLTKVLTRDENVADVGISLEDKTVTILLTEDGTMDDEAVTEAVLNAGYNVASIARGDS